jgi:hypothetical protein
MSDKVQEQPKPANKTVRRLFLPCLFVWLAIIAAISYFVDHMPLRIIIPSFLLTVLIILLVRRWQRRSGMLK